MRSSATLLVRRRLRAEEYASHPRTEDKAETRLPPRYPLCPAFLLRRAAYHAASDFFDQHLRK